MEVGSVWLQQRNDIPNEAWPRDSQRLPLLREARGMLYSGIDLHKRTLAIHTIDAAGTLVRKADLQTNRAAVTAYFANLNGPYQAVCKCTSVWYWVRDILAPQGIDLRFAHAKHLKAISYA